MKDWKGVAGVLEAQRSKELNVPEVQKSGGEEQSLSFSMKLLGEYRINKEQSGETFQATFPFLNSQVAKLRSFTFFLDFITRWINQSRSSAIDLISLLQGSSISQSAQLLSLVSLQRKIRGLRNFWDLHQSLGKEMWKQPKIPGNRNFFDLHQSLGKEIDLQRKIRGFGNFFDLKSHHRREMWKQRKIRGLRTENWLIDEPRNKRKKEGK